jgi:hypothetical protein
MTDLSEKKAGEPTESPRYEIERVWDFLNVPEDRLDECLREFRIMLDMARATASLLDHIGALTLGDDAPRWEPANFVWIDDDKGHASITVLTDPAPSVSSMPEGGQC